MTVLSLDEKPATNHEPAAESDVMQFRDSFPEIDREPVNIGWRKAVNKPRILFVDDDESFLGLCLRKLESADYEVLTATSAEAALNLLDESPVDVVVSDLCMPQQSGAELMQKVESRHPRVIRIVVSGKLDIAETIQAINKGHVHHYIVKPFDIKSFKLTLYQSLLARERAEQEERRKKERQNNAKQRARDMASTALETRKKVDLAYLEALSALELIAGSAGQTDRDALPGIAGTIARALDLATTDVYQIEVAARLLGLVDQFGTETAARSVARLSPLGGAAKILACSCEVFNGSGTPYGLRGQELPVGARIIQVAVEYEALRARGISHCAAVEELVESAGLFDPSVVEALSQQADVSVERRAD